jgi:fructokinase
MRGPIVGIGELLWDIYPDGRKVAGGAPFNFAFHCHQLGHEAVIVSRVGDDDLGKELRQEVRRAGMSDTYVRTDKRHPTGTVRVTLNDRVQPNYSIQRGAAWEFIPFDWNRLFVNLISRASVFCYGSLTFQTITGRTVERILWESVQLPRAPIRIFDVNLRMHFHPYDNLGQLLRDSDWLKVNQSEMSELARLYPNAGFDSEAYTKKHRELRTPSPRVHILSQGSKGVKITTENRSYDEPAAPANVLDTVGAGDAFTAAMACLHLEGRPLRECARFANYYAARVCEHVGATPTIHRAEVERAAFG